MRDNWWIKNDKVWFWSRKDILCYLAMKSGECKLLTCIPDRSHLKFRLTSFCMKYCDNIYCMPLYGKSIWIYNTISYRFDEICINAPNSVMLNIRDFWEYENKIYIIKWTGTDYGDRSGFEEN